MSAAFKHFCESSSIHGIAYWHNDQPMAVRILWGCVTILGFVSASYMIRNNFTSWESNPIIVSVWQVPIEESPFPGITICPLDDTRFGAIELVWNEVDPMSIEKDLIDLFRLLIQNLMEEYEMDSKLIRCGELECSSNIEDQTNCTQEKEDFYDFIYTMKYNDKDYIRNNVNSFARNIVKGLALPVNKKRPSRSIPLIPSNCNESFKASHFLFRHLPSFFNDPSRGLKVGTLISWILAHSEGDDKYKEIFDVIRRITDPSKHPDAYAGKFGGSDKLLIHDMVQSLTNNDRSSIDGIKYSSELLQTMKLSMSPAEVLLDSGVINPHPGVPFCFYAGDDKEGIPLGYEKNFCQSMQPVINDEGLCYSFNNENFGLQPGYESTSISRNVKGTGVKKGLTLVVDSHSSYYGRNSSKGFKVLVAKRGDVGGKVKYIVHPEFFGETNFHLSGIHYVQSTPGFRKWNEVNQFCYFVNGKNLTHFQVYSQENCLIECKIQKVIHSCGCSPWFTNETRYKLCDAKGMTCYYQSIENYEDDLPDRKTCDCKNDCEMVHFIFTMNQHKYEDRKPREPQYWFNKDNGEGILSDYLLDPQGIFLDDTTTKFSMLSRNTSSDIENSQRRFKNDIAIMNFYYVTPIITYVFLELKVSIFDQISAIGGQLGLFTGFSLISGFEIIYWVLAAIIELITGQT